MRLGGRRIASPAARRRHRAPARSARRRARGRRSAAAARPTGARRGTRPGPRISRSCRAISKPSVVSKITLSRCLADVGQRLLEQQHARALVGAAADAAAQLVQLREAEPLGVLDDHDRRVRHVDADFDDRRRDEHVDVAARRTPSIVAAFSSGFIRPCSRPTRIAGDASNARVSSACSATAVCSSSFSDSSISGHTQYTWRPSRQRLADPARRSRRAASG